MKPTTSRNDPPTPPKQRSRSRRLTNGVCPVRLCKIGSESFTLWFGFWAPILSGIFSASNRSYLMIMLIRVRNSHYFCKKCPCKRLHWQFSDKRHCDECGHKPMDHVCFWNTEILTPIAKYGIEEGGPGHTAFKKLKVLLDRMMLRRTKLERADDLGLPPRTIVVRRDYFSPQEKELYMSLFTNAKRQFATYVGQGTVLNSESSRVQIEQIVLPSASWLISCI